jgi:hypothetical protein
VPRGGKRPGAGRPPGSKDSSPRIKRADVLNARREQWDAWEKSQGALKKVRKRLLAIVENGSDKDALAAAKLVEERGLGRPVEAREELPQQTLVIITTGDAVPTPQQIEAGYIEGEVVEVSGGDD